MTNDDRYFSDHNPFGQIQGNELIEVLQEIRDELRDIKCNMPGDGDSSSEIRTVAVNLCDVASELGSCSASLTAIAEILEEK